MCKNGWRRSGSICFVIDINIYLVDKTKGDGCQNARANFAHMPSVLYDEWQHFALHSQFFRHGLMLQEKDSKITLSFLGPPPFVYLGRYSCDKISQAREWGYWPHIILWTATYHCEHGKASEHSHISYIVHMSMQSYPVIIHFWWSNFITSEMDSAWGRAS